ncbi:MAG TPA: hypothetical protein VKB50_20165 [Vicinamibacterales bacterium]|nr:hypothetical protein [Vicinamibacterales bacterium]
MRVVSILLLSLSSAAAAERYVRATVGEDGQLRIATAAGRTIEPIKETDQVRFAKPEIAPGGGAVGWLAEYANCCTSYPIALKLMIRSGDRVRAFAGNGLPIWQWGFQSGGSQFAFHQETVHGGLGVHYELRDVASGRLIARYDPAVGADNQVLPSQNVPAWVAELSTRVAGQDRGWD